MWVAKEDTLGIRNVQHALYTRSKEHLAYVFEKLGGLVTTAGTSEPPSLACSETAARGRRAWTGSLAETWSCELRRRSPR
jgi:hypothetical protein